MGGGEDFTVLCPPHPASHINMAITLTSAYLAELKKNVNRPNVVIEVELDSGSRRFGFHDGRLESDSLSCAADGGWYACAAIEASGQSGYAAGGIDGVTPCLKGISSLQNKIDTKGGYTTRGQLTFVINGRDNWKNLIRDEYLKNRRVTRKDGFAGSGFAYSDYAVSFTGKIIDWSRKGDELTVVVGDEMLVNGSKKVPVENETKTQYLDYRNIHPVDAMTDMLTAQLGIGASYVDAARFTSEGDTWLSGWRFDRVLTEPLKADEYLNQLQVETNSFIIHDGEKVSFKVFAPPVPGTQVEEWSDAKEILEDSFAVKSGYRENFYNRVIVYYDYDESGADNDENFEAAVIAVDSASQDATQWNEASTKTIKSRWMRSRTHVQPTNISGVVIYHVSRANGAGTGYLTYNKADNALQWTAPGGSVGAAVTLTKDGRYQIYGSDQTQYVRVIADTSALPAANSNDSIEITALAADTFASTLAQKIINRYRNPAATVTFDVDLNNAAYGGVFIKPTDIKDITTDEACELGSASWTKERVMLTSVRPDAAAGKVSVEGIETRFYRCYGFIAPAGNPDYPDATAVQREYGFVGNASNKVNAGTGDGYYIW